jgi:hypothetical protein
MHDGGDLVDALGESGEPKSRGAWRAGFHSGTP